MFYGGAVSWISKTQRIIAMSTTESEYIALSAIAQEVLFLRSVLELLQPHVEKHCVPFAEDIDEVSKLVENTSNLGRTLMLDVTFYEILLTGMRFSVNYLSTLDQTEDVLTKNISENGFERHVTSLMNL
ncbi:unnamed protein product [Discosporangium mesarthrocarpum]